MSSEKELDAQHTKEIAELDAKGQAHLDAVPAGKGKVARDKAAALEVEQWVFEMKERHAEEIDELAAGGSGDAAPAEAPKVTLSHSETKKAAADAKAKADSEEAEAKKLKQDKARKKKQDIKDKEKAHEAEVERERRLNPPIPVVEKGKGYGKGEGGGGGACRAFAAGNCSFGDKCRFSHTPAGAGER